MLDSGHLLLWSSQEGLCHHRAELFSYDTLIPCVRRSAGLSLVVIYLTVNCGMRLSISFTLFKKRTLVKVCGLATNIGLSDYHTQIGYIFLF